jgi:ribonuclease E
MKRASNEEVKRIQVECHTRVADFLINRKRRDIIDLEERYGITVTIQTGMNVTPEHLVVKCLNDIGQEVSILGSGDSYSRS